MNRLLAAGLIWLVSGCQTNPGTPVGPEAARQQTPRAEALPEYQTVDSGLTDCGIPFEELARRSPACRGAEAGNGRRCEPYSPTQFPEVVAISRAGKLECSGTLIAPDWVLTAAHCVTEPNADPRRAGFHYVRDPLTVVASFAYVLSAHYSHGAADQERRAARLFVFDGYSGPPGYEADLALIRLDRPYPERAVQPARLAAADQLSAAATMAGYGVSNAEGGSIGYLNVNWPASVSPSQGALITFTPTDSSAFCKGDSGGPMFAGRYRGCGRAGVGGEPRPRLLQAVISRFSNGGKIYAAFSTTDQAKMCMDAEQMTGESVAEPGVRRWICGTTERVALGCR